MSGFTRHRRSGRIIATFSGFEADLLRSLASQLVELLRNEAAVPREHADPLEAMLSFDGPTTEPEDPVLARLFPTAYADDEEAAAEFRRFTEGTLRDGKAAGAATIIDTLEEAGLPPELGDQKVVIDVELDEPAAGSGCSPSPTCGSRWRPGSRSSRTTRTFWRALPGRRPAVPGARHLRVDRGTSRRPWSTPCIERAALTRSTPLSRAAPPCSDDLRPFTHRRTHP